jgi:hypothetical protein
LKSASDWSSDVCSSDLFGIEPIYTDGKPGEARDTLNTSSTANWVLGWDPRRELEDYLKEIFR